MIWLIGQQTLPKNHNVSTAAKSIAIIFSCLTYLANELQHKATITSKKFLSIHLQRHFAGKHSMKNNELQHEAHNGKNEQYNYNEKKTIEKTRKQKKTIEKSQKRQTEPNDSMEGKK